MRVVRTELLPERVTDLSHGAQGGESVSHRMEEVRVAARSLMQTSLKLGGKLHLPKFLQRNTSLIDRTKRVIYAVDAGAGAVGVRGGERQRARARLSKAAVTADRPGRRRVEAVSIERR